MRHFDEIFELAAQRKGGAKALKKILAETQSLSPSDIAAIPDDRILAAMTRCVFCAGFYSKVIDAKWDSFESAFQKFNPSRCAAMTEERFDELLKCKDIVRNGPKILSVHKNGQFVMELAEKHGSAAQFFAKWPDADYVGLLDFLKKKANRLGGVTGMRFLRSIGKPAFIITPDVTAALIREGVIDKEPSGKRDFSAMQSAFNRWSAESGCDLTEISRILAMSVHNTNPPNLHIRNRT